MLVTHGENEVILGRRKAIQTFQLEWSKPADEDSRVMI